MTIKNPSVLLLVLVALASANAADDRAVLTEFYQATGGDNWFERSGWLEAESICDWHGVGCRTDETGIERVTRLELEWNGLSGSLPASLASLNELNLLSLRGNGLQGLLPAALIEALAALPGSAVLTIDLGENALSGALPEIAAPADGRPLDLALDSNQINGPLPASWSGLALRDLYLDRNPLATTLPTGWSDMNELRRLGLASTQLTGSFPDALAGLTALEDLDLSDNALDGELPDWLAQASLLRLNLEGNDLEGSITPAVEAMRLDVPVGLNLANNRFSGTLPDRLLELSFAPARGLTTLTGRHRLDLCWNDFDAGDEAFADLLGEVHHGGSFTACQGQLASLNPEISGSWYLPTRAGEGYAQMLLDSGGMLVYWFTFPPQRPVPGGEQAWFFSVVDPRPEAATLDPMFATSGRFGQGIAGRRAEPADLRLTLNASAGGDLHAAYSLASPYSGGLGGTLVLDHHSGSDRLTQLTRLAGSRCDNQLEQQWISGAWFNPDQVGEGFIVEVNEDGRGVVYWFTHVPESNGNYQAWMTGDAFFDGQTLAIDNLLMPVGTAFGSDFDADSVEVRHWGSLTLQFNDDHTGQAWYDSVLPDYGSGQFTLSRLARAQLADCPGD
ncbi:MAG: hypothetical protein EA370_15820 [Wenzhouxiangella sp.]|nr:MAG: hypothetical protein EA370_15820 [Wenzhouxiangella sp.]